MCFTVHYIGHAFRDEFHCGNFFRALGGARCALNSQYEIGVFSSILMDRKTNVHFAVKFPDFVSLIAFPNLVRFAIISLWEHFFCPDDGDSGPS